MPSLHITAIETESELQAWASAWEALFAEAEEVTPFQSYPWHSAFLTHKGQGRGKLLILLFLEEAPGTDVLRGIIPLWIVPLVGLPLRRVTFVGSPLADYQNLLAAPGFGKACVEALWDYLWQVRASWDIVDLTDVPATVPLAERPPGLEELRILPHRICPYVELPENWQLLSASLTRKMRSNINRGRKQLLRDHQAVHQRIQNEADLPPAMAVLYRLHNQRWAARGLRGAFSSPETRRFHDALAPLFLKEGWLRLHVLRTGDTLHAAFYCFLHRGRIFYYLSGFDLSLSRYSPGMVLLSHVLEDGMKDGGRVLDFLRGDENYKYAWRAKDQRTVRVLLAKPTLRSLVCLGVIWIERRLEDIGTYLRNRLFGRRSKKRATLSE